MSSCPASLVRRFARPTMTVVQLLAVATSCSAEPLEPDLGPAPPASMMPDPVEKPIDVTTPEALGIDVTPRLKTLKVAMFGLSGHFPDILWDGYQDSKNLVNGVPPADERICIRNENVDVLNADGPNKYNNPKVDKTSFQCELAKLPSIELPGKA